MLKKYWKAAVCILLIIVALAGLAIGGLRFCFGIDVFDRSGWMVSEDGTVRYLDYYGEPLVGWNTIDDKVYYFSPEMDGARVSGWQTVDGATRFFHQNGVLAVGWVDLNGLRYFFDDDGAMCVGWLEDGGSRYYLSERGIVETGWLRVDGGTYYFDEDGAMQTGWLEQGEGRYYLSDTGEMVTGWQLHDGQQYFLSEDGIMLTGWIEVDGSRYYLDESGAMQTGWLAQEDGRYFLRDDGSTAVGWENFEDGRRYFDGGGRMCTGWIEEDGVRFFADDTGILQTGWLETDGERYYLREDGSAARGKVIIDGTARYFDSAGRYVILVNPWNYVPEDYEVQLVSLGQHKVAAECKEALEQLVAACREQGYRCSINWVYRTWDTQNYLWTSEVERCVEAGYTLEEAQRITSESVAVPGTSEHQLGLAVDFGCGNPGYAWLAEHSWEYGFVERYPYGKTNYTGIIYEPWHFRYVGRELAAELYELGLCLEEYMEQLTAAEAQRMGET